MFRVENVSITTGSSVYSTEHQDSVVATGDITHNATASPGAADWFDTLWGLEF